MVKKPQGIDPVASFEAFKEKLKETDLNVYFIFGAIALILIVGVYALFSAETQSNGNPACGKIVIAATGRSLASNVAPTLQEAKYFLVVDPLTGKMVEIVKNPYMGVQPDPQIAYLVAGKGEEAVIVNNIDQQSYNVLMQFGIRVFGGYQGRSQKVLKLYRQARIAPSQQPMVNEVQEVPLMQGQGMGMQNMPQQPVAVQPGMGMNRPNCPLPYVNQQGVIQGNMQPAFQGQQQVVMPNGMGMGMNQPNCPLPYVNQQAMMQGNMQPVFQNQQQAGMGMNQPNCPLPYFNQGGAMQVGVQNGMGMNQPNCPLPYVNQQGMMQGNMQPVFQGQQQVGMGMNQPNCPLPYYNQGGGIQNGMAVQPAFGTGMQTFICPNCNWRMSSQVGPNEFARCPNCGQIMGRGMASSVPMGQNMQNNPGFYNPGFNGNVPVQQGLTQVAVASPQMAQQVQTAPPIPANATMLHAYRGACTNCHQILPATTVPVPLGNAVQDPNVAHMAIGGK